MNKKLAIIILGGGLKKEKGKWRTTNFNEGDKFGISGDRLRVVAGSYLYKKTVNQLFIVSGGKGQLKHILKAPNIAEVLKTELVELGVPANKIIKEINSGNTYQQLYELQKIIKEKKLQDIIVISNQHHLPRLKAMIGYSPKLTGLKRLLKASQLKLQSAEGILIKYKPTQWQKVIKRAYVSSAMKKRIALEQEGIKQIRAGTYRFI